MQPGDIVCSRVYKSLLWTDIVPSTSTPVRFKMWGRTETLDNLAIVVAVPNYFGLGATQLGGSSVAVLLLVMPSCQLRWTWTHMIEVFVDANHAR